MSCKATLPPMFNKNEDFSTPERRRYICRVLELELRPDRCTHLDGGRSHPLYSWMAIDLELLLAGVRHRLKLEMPCKASTSPLDFVVGNVPRSVWDQVIRRKRRISWLARSTPETVATWERRGFRYVYEKEMRRWADLQQSQSQSQ
ncbi:hypothetical protein Dda_0045 [Drechslerella dactyloides]|uniref:Uncharacterized protein n=1 Tax=Drechslerella dactyloides TaxID=74499 RepID=A0AAD6J3M4_DREDA|nr:hypothetical protein Dda_0045 [Drechslerella dactyloides]